MGLVEVSPSELVARHGFSIDESRQFFMKRTKFFQMVIVWAVALSAKAQIAQVSTEVATIQGNQLDIEGGDTADPTAATTYSIQATVPPNTEAWVPLGAFIYGGHYTISVSAQGAGANSSGECKFSTIYGLAPRVLSLSTHQGINGFRFYSRRVSGAFPLGGWSYVAIKYKNLAGNSDNNLTITITADSSDRWNPNQLLSDYNVLTDANLMLPIIANEYSASNAQFPSSFNGVQINRPLEATQGMTVNGSPVMTRASGVGSSASSTGFSGGTSTLATGSNSIAFGEEARAVARATFATGRGSQANGEFSVAVGHNSKAYGRGSVAMGTSTQAGPMEDASTFERAATAFGYSTKALGSYSLATGRQTVAEGTASTAVGYYSRAIGNYTFAAGYHPDANGLSSIALGNHAQANGDYSVSIGSGNKAEGKFAIAIGRNNKALGEGSFVTGRESEASGPHSTAHNLQAKALGKYSFASGRGSEASGSDSAANNFQTKALGNFSTANGIRNIASSYAQFVVGLYNEDLGGDKIRRKSDNALFVVGNGSGLGADQRSNAFEVRQNGSTTTKGDAIVEGVARLGGGADIKGAVTIEPQGDISMGIFE